MQNCYGENFKINHWYDQYVMLNEVILNGRHFHHRFVLMRHKLKKNY